MQDHLWYVAYGSNTAKSYFASRFGPTSPERSDPIWSEETWTWLPYDLYFAGSSRTWDGSAVAFVSLERSDSDRTAGRAYLIRHAEFETVLAAEHLSIPLPWAFDIRQLQVEDWCPLPTPAKYNAILRLADIDGRPAYPITTARNLKAGPPGEAYLAKFREGLASAPLVGDVGEYLDAAIEQSVAVAERNVIPPRPGAPFVWHRELVPLKSTRFPTVQLGAAEAWIEAAGPFPGQVSHNGRVVPTWLFPPEEGHPEGASAQVFRALGYRDPFPASIACRISAAYPVRVRRIPGISEDIEIADHLQVSFESEGRFGPWALLMGPSLSGPVKLSPSEHVPRDAVRVPYAARELWEIDEDEGSISLLPLDSEKSQAGAALKHAFQGVIEWLIGAPAVPLRATEAVVGDEGRSVVRVDATALDFLGVSAGGHVIVSWAGQEATARVLLQTDDLRVRMSDQLAQTTGRQSRLSTRAASGSEKILWHVQVWLSPAVRDALVIPPDTIVRLRRSVAHLLLRNLISLQLPVVGLLLAMTAVSNMPLWLWIVVPLITVVLAFVPLRLSHN